MGTQLPFLTKGGTAPQFSTHIYCRKMVGWIKIPFGGKVGLGPGQATLCYMGTQLSPPPPKRGTAPNFRPMSIVAKRSPISATAERLLNFSEMQRQENVKILSSQHLLSLQSLAKAHHSSRC